jgi:ParB family chromosome partitioning protein
MGKEGQTFEIPKPSSKIEKVADVFMSQEQRQPESDKLERIVEIPLSEIDDFPDHPFRVKNDETMQNMIDSIKAVGIQTPAIARQKEDGRYELISGHRRKMAATLAELETMPIIVRVLTRDEAIIAMVDANLQREIILPSERALSYKMKMDAMKRQGQRTDLTSRPMVGKSECADIVGEAAGESGRQVQRYIRLNELNPQILQMVDEGKMGLRSAVEVSYLPEEQQSALLETMESDETTPSLAQAIKMKQFSQGGKLNDDVILSIMTEEKPNQKEQIKVPYERIRKFLPEDYNAKKTEELIVKLIENWYRKRERERNDAR